MNSNDEKLKDFFYDIVHVSYYQNSDGLSKFYDECMQILKDKSYSNINIQDEDGNTYLHYITKHAKWNWFIKLLDHGADPTILNNEGRNPFTSSRKETGNLWRMSPLKDVDSFSDRGFIEPTKNFAPNFKEHLFNSHLLGNGHMFEDISSAIKFLQKAQIDSDINKIKLVAVSKFINTNKKFKWYKENYNNPQHNTEFFNKIIKAIPYDAEARKFFWGSLSKFLENKLEQYNEFNKSVNLILKENLNELNMDFCKSVVKTLINQKFDLDVKADGEQQTLRQLIETNPVFYSVYMDETLSKKNSLTKKRLKV
jgi:hypothetical protein